MARFNGIQIENVLHCLFLSSTYDSTHNYYLAMKAVEEVFYYNITKWNLLRFLSGKVSLFSLWALENIYSAKLILYMS